MHRAVTTAWIRKGAKQSRNDPVLTLERAIALLQRSTILLLTGHVTPVSFFSSKTPADAGARAPAFAFKNTQITIGIS